MAAIKTSPAMIPAVAISEPLGQRWEATRAPSELGAQGGKNTALLF